MCCDPGMALRGQRPPYFLSSSGVYLTREISRAPRAAICALHESSPLVGNLPRARQRVTFQGGPVSLPYCRDSRYGNPAVLLTSDSPLGDHRVNRIAEVVLFVKGSLFQCLHVLVLVFAVLGVVVFVLRVQILF